MTPAEADTENVRNYRHDSESEEKPETLESKLLSAYGMFEKSLGAIGHELTCLKSNN
jgi:hypothetical protein